MIHLRYGRALPLALAACAFVSAAPEAQAGWRAGNNTPSVRDFVPTLSDEEAYSERYSLAADFDNGDHVGVEFTISNIGFGDHNLAVNLRVRPKGVKQYTFSKKYDDDEWASGKKTLSIKVGPTAFYASGKNTFRLKHNGGSYKVDLTYTNLDAMWRPGSGRLALKEGYYKFGLFLPRGKVTGRIFHSGKWHQVVSSRRGWGEHTATNLAPYDMAKRFMSSRHYLNDVYVAWREITLTKDHGGGKATWMVVYYKDKIVFASRKATVREGRVRTDSTSEYRVPFALQIDASSGKDSVSMVMRATKQKRKDLLAGYGSAIRGIARAVSKPFRFEMRGKYSLKMSIGGAEATVSSKGRYNVDYINP